jgi:hypothetical protein
VVENARFVWRLTKANKQWVYLLFGNCSVLARSGAAKAAIGVNSIEAQDKAS